MGRITSLTDLPVEIIERIVAKCQENDIEILADDHKVVVKRDDSAHPADKDPADEAGWETEEDEEEETVANHTDSILGIDDEYGDEILSSGSCMTCGDYHRIGKRFCEYGDDFALDNMPPPPSLHQLAMVSKFFRELALPYIHQSVDFEALNNRKLEQYLELVVPKYGHLVKDIWIRISAGENSEFFLMGNQEASTPERYQPERRYELALKLFRALPNLVSIDIDYTWLDPESGHGQMGDLFSNIRDRGAKILGLHLAADTMSCRFTSTLLCPLLRDLTKLESLEISGIDRQSAVEPLLEDAIASLPNLQVLDLADAHCVQDDWAEADWQCTLKALELDDCQNISGQGVDALIRRHAATLRHLTLSGTPYQNIGNFNSGNPFDMPNLSTLSLDDYQFNINLIKRFEACPMLSRLELGTLDDMNPRELTQMFEREGFPALKELMLTCDWPTAAEHPGMDSLELICFEKGIALEVEPPDSDDEDDDDDMSFDDEDPDHELWEEGFTEDEDEDGDHMTDEDEDDQEDSSADDAF